MYLPVGRVSAFMLPYIFISPVLHLPCTCSKGKGMSSSAIPYKRTPPSWCKATATEVRAVLFECADVGAALVPANQATCCVPYSMQFVVCDCECV